MGINIDRLRQSLKVKWLDYYRENRPWLAQLRIWVSFEGECRPSSSFILATLSILEPRLQQLFPFIVELNNNPDRVVAALGLNFNPDRELQLLQAAETNEEKPLKFLPGSVDNPEIAGKTVGGTSLPLPSKASNRIAPDDEVDCWGSRGIGD